MQDELLTVEEAATLAKRSASSLWRWLRTGALEAVVVAGRTRFHRADVLRLLEPRTRASWQRGRKPAVNRQKRSARGEG